MFDEKLKVAYEKAEEISQYLNYNSDRMVSTQEIIKAVEEHYCSDVDISFTSFKKANIDKPYGAMMQIDLEDDGVIPRRAAIILNSDNDPAFQRFSLLHEIGHLVIRAWESRQVHETVDSKKFVVSTHIDYKITNISETKCEDDVYLQNEQIANVFALRVLMPSKQFYDKIRECQDISEVADFFGVTKEAIISRAMIGA